MRTLIEIPEQQIIALKDLCQSQGLSRAEAIRRAIDVYLQQQSPGEVDAFGLWQHNKPEIEDGLEYQKRVREEW